jgi:catechol 2,3-dioxygenase
MIQSLDDLKEDYARLKALDVKIDDVVDHGLSLGIYFRDPDGHAVEMSYELPREQWSREERILGHDVVGLGRFPGPWDAEVVRRRQPWLNYRLPNTSSNRSIIAFHERLSATAL